MITPGPLVDFVHGGGKNGANGPSGERLASRGLPWQAEATQCGALSSPAGLTFLSLRGAAPASYPTLFRANSTNSFRALSLSQINFNPLQPLFFINGRIDEDPFTSITLL